MSSAPAFPGATALSAVHEAAERKIDHYLLLPQEWDLHAGLRQAGQAVIDEARPRLKARLREWVIESNVSSLARTPDSGSDGESGLDGALAKRLLDEAALNLLDHQGAAHEAWRARVATTAGWCRQVPQRAMWAEVLLLIARLPVEEQATALEQERQVLLRWGQPRPAVRARPAFSLDAHASEWVVRARGGNANRRPPVAMVPVLAWALLREEPMPLFGSGGAAPPDRATRCAGLQWALANALAAQAAEPAVLHNAFRHALTHRLGEVPVAAQGNATAAAQASQTPTGAEVEEAAYVLSWWGDLEGLERLYAQVDRPALYDAFGNALKQRFRRGTQDTFETADRAGASYTFEIDALTLAWTAQRPLSPLVHWMRAQALIGAAWDWRGRGPAGTVAPRAWVEFNRLLNSGAQHLAATSAVSLRDSSSHVMLLGIARGLSWDLERQGRIVPVGLERYREDLGLWAGLLTSTLPRWGGSAAQVDRLIHDAASFHKQRGDEVYAQLYHAASHEEFGDTVFRDTAADWPRIRKGLREAIGRWPGKAVFWNRMAYFACLKEDRQTLAEALDAVGQQPLLAEWGRTGRNLFESCRKLAGRG